MPEPLRFDKVTAGPGRSAANTRSADDRTRLVVKVRKPGYVPDGFTVRSRVDSMLFTAEAAEGDVAAAAADPEVESLERGRGLHLS